MIELVEVVDNDDFSEDERIAELEDAVGSSFTVIQSVLHAMICL